MSQRSASSSSSSLDSSDLQPVSKHNSTDLKDELKDHSKDSKDLKDNSKPKTSETSQCSRRSSEAEHHFNESVPLDLTGVTDDAVSRQLSRIQSRRSQSQPNDVSIHATKSGKELGHNASRDASLDEVTDLHLQKTYSLSDDPKFNRYTPRRKKMFVVVSSLACFLSPLSGLSFLPAVPEIATRFHTTGEIINVSSAIYCVFMSISPCIFSPISDIYGRRFTFLFCSLMFAICTILVAVSANLAMFFIFRALTALFGTSFFSVGAHVVADLYIPQERGNNMAWIISGAQIGSAFGAVIGGIIVNFTSWRVIFWALAGAGFGVFIMAFFLLEETSTETKHARVLEQVRLTQPNKKFVFIAFNPLRIIRALKYPTLSIDGFITICLVFNMYTLVTPIRYVVDPRFHLTEPIYSGLFYLAPGLGYLIGSFFGGRWADHVVKQWIVKRGRRVPEDRLRQTFIPLGVFYPISILIYGWSIETEKGGIAVPVIFMFISGLAQTTTFPASNAYCVDSMPELAGDAIGSSYFTRYIAAAVASAACLKSINSIGVGWTCTYSAFLLWIGLGCSIVLVRYGEEMRLKSLVRNGLRKPEDLDILKSDDKV